MPDATEISGTIKGCRTTAVFLLDWVPGLFDRLAYRFRRDPYGVRFHELRYLVGCFRQGQLSKFPRNIVDDAFGALIEKRTRQGWPLVGGREIIADQGDMIDGFSVNRPPGSDAFWNGVLEVLRKTPSVLYWPGTGAIIGNEATMAELPPDMIETLGEFKVCSTHREITAFIESS